jgi:hypothetical protein
MTGFLAVHNINEKPQTIFDDFQSLWQITLQNFDFARQIFQSSYGRIVTSDNGGGCNDIVDGLQYQITTSIDSQGQKLNGYNVRIAVNDQSRQIISLAMHQSNGIDVTIDGVSHIQRLLEAGAVEIDGIDAFALPGQKANRD